MLVNVERRAMQGSESRCEAAEDGIGDESDNHSGEERAYQGPRGAAGGPYLLRRRGQQCRSYNCRVIVIEQ